MVFVVYSIFFTAKSAMNLWLINENEKSNELVRTKTNSCDVILFEFVGFVAIFFSYHYAKSANI